MEKNNNTQASSRTRSRRRKDSPKNEKMVSWFFIVLIIIILFTVVFTAVKMVPLTDLSAKEPLILESSRSVESETLDSYSSSNESNSSGR